MVRPSVSFYFLLLLLIFTSVKNMVPKVNGDCQQAVKGGGCPDVSKCVETCRPCYRGVGQITAFCRSAGGGIPFDECAVTSPMVPLVTHQLHPSVLVILLLLTI
ncbi:hypothetical protein CRYUN_Cryun36dG0058800 [Craigia yunnanensis]